MKKALSLLAVVFALGLSTVSLDAEARRIGGGKSVGMQRQATPPPSTPNATPAQTPSAAPGAAAAAPAAAAASTRSKWMGPIAGLAAGLGLAALASHLGFGEGLANMLMIGLLIMAVLAVVGMVMRKRAAAQAGGGQRMAYAGNSAGEPRSPGFGSAAPSGSTGAAGGSMIGSAIGGAPSSETRPIPADFDVAAFVRNAKVNYMRLQAANDAGNLDDLREFTSPEVFAELQMDIRERNGAAQDTRVLELNADVLEVVEEGNRYIVSVHFSGRVQEDGGDPDTINEVWHLTKSRQGSGGWVLAGVQQVA
jgi:predicted lipid-binding transport protein (Tim44 family)